MKIVLFLVSFSFTTLLFGQNGKDVVPKLKQELGTTQCLVMNISGENVYVLTDTIPENITIEKAVRCFRLMPPERPRAMFGIHKSGKITCGYDETLRSNPLYIVSFKNRVPMNFNSDVKKCLKEETEDTVST